MGREWFIYWDNELCCKIIVDKETGAALPIYVVYSESTAKEYLLNQVEHKVKNVINNMIEWLD